MCCCRMVVRSLPLQGKMPHGMARARCIRPRPRTAALRAVVAAALRLAHDPGRVGVARGRCLRRLGGSADVMAKKSPDPVDRYVGSRVRMRRKMLGMSQGKLADALGLTFQQVQKYEKGTNRMGASRLQQIAHVPVRGRAAPSWPAEGNRRGPVASLRGGVPRLVRRACAHQGIHAHQGAQAAAPHRDPCRRHCRRLRTVDPRRNKRSALRRPG